MEPCGLNISTITIGDNYNRKDEEDYIYVPKDQLSGTYTKGGDRTITIVRNGLTITYTEDGPGFLLEIELAYSNDYYNFTINGESIDGDLDPCYGTVTGNGIRVGTVGIEIGFNYLQYRTPSNQYIGWIQVYKDGIPPEASDITIELKDSDDDIVDITWNSLYYESYIGEWNYSTSSVDFSGPTYFSGFVGGGFEFPAGNYTWEVTPSGGEVVKEPISYPGKKELPLVDSVTMESVWDVDGNLILSWTNPPNNPPGDYDEVVVKLISDVDVTEMLIVYLPTDVSEMTIPSEWVEILEKFFETTFVKWWVQTRSHTDDEGMNDARGVQVKMPIPPRP